MSDEGRIARPVFILFAIISGLIGVDLIADWGEGAGAEHLALEGIVMGCAAVGMAIAAKRLLALRQTAQSLRRHTEELRSELVQSRSEASHWRGEANEILAGLGVAIDRQFERWALSPAEREVGLLLLKGLSHQEIADVRGTSERTVRQQARALYKKAGLGGRADLAAYFLEDLLLPIQPGDSARTVSTGTEDSRTVFSATLPSSARLRPRRP